MIWIMIYNANTKQITLISETTQPTYPHLPSHLLCKVFDTEVEMLDYIEQNNLELPEEFDNEN